MFSINFGFTRSTAAFIVVIAALLLSGCGTAHHNVSFVPGYQPASTATITLGDVIDAAPTFERDDEHKNFNIAKKLREQLASKLRDAGLCADSTSAVQSLVLSVRIVNYEPGNAFKRWLMPGYGSTVLTVECALRDGAEKVATVNARRTVDGGGGYTIGAWETIFSSVAEDIVTGLKEKLRATS